ncbi:MAG: hypothetical protein AVDCRST_MAG04-2685, partial [uncultured Acetobacteraceae bacterium]
AARPRRVALPRGLGVPLRRHLARHQARLRPRDAALVRAEPRRTRGAGVHAAAGGIAAAAAARPRRPTRGRGHRRAPARRLLRAHPFGVGLRAGRAHRHPEQRHGVLAGAAVRAGAGRAGVAAAVGGGGGRVARRAGADGALGGAGGRLGGAFARLRAAARGEPRLERRHPGDAPFPAAAPGDGVAALVLRPRRRAAAALGAAARAGGRHRAGGLAARRLRRRGGGAGRHLGDHRGGAALVRYARLARLPGDPGLRGGVVEPVAGRTAGLGRAAGLRARPRRRRHRRARV